MSAALHGVECFPVQVEVDLTSGLPSFAVVGLPEGAVREGRERVMSALRNSGMNIPPRRITVNLAPADVRKEGSAFDLPIALGLMGSAGVISSDSLDGAVFVGELGLDGDLRPIRGALAISLWCAEVGIPTLLLPSANATEAAVVEGVQVLGARSIGQILAHFRGEEEIQPTVSQVGEPDEVKESPGAVLEEVRGQAHAKRALEIVAAGGHNLLLIGPPGSGKTMLARRIPGILPELCRHESIEVTKIHSVLGLSATHDGLIRARPFRVPHHTISAAGLVGGGSHPKPGEISLAHNGVLFLDELPEFRRSVLEVLRQPWEDGTVTIARARQVVRYPARFLLIAAMNPCPCGYFGDGTDRCSCSPARVARYRGRVSGPLLDRIDLHVEVPAVPAEELHGPPVGPTTVEVRERAAAARGIQRQRLDERHGSFTNAHMGPRELREHCAVSKEVARFLQAALTKLNLSTRAYHRILKVARTIADLDEKEMLGVEHVAEAVQYRALDRRWGTTTPNR